MNPGKINIGDNKFVLGKVIDLKGSLCGKFIIVTLNPDTNNPVDIWIHYSKKGETILSGNGSKNIKTGDIVFVLGKVVGKKPIGFSALVELEFKENSKDRKPLPEEIVKIWTCPQLIVE